MNAHVRHVRRAVATILAGALVWVVPGVGVANHRDGGAVLRAQDGVDAAIAWSKELYPTGAEAALLGTVEDFADALSGGLAQAQLKAPLLLTPSDTLDPRVRQELTRLGATTVHLLGGVNALSAEIEAELTEAGLATQRHSGATRVDTAVELAKSQAPDATGAVIARAFGDANGGDPTRAWADSVAAGALAAQTGQPLLLTETAKLSASLSAYLDAAKVTAVTVVGGAAAVSDAVLSELAALGLQVQRVSGPSRAATAVAIAQRRGLPDAASADRIVLVDGQSPSAWPGGIAGAGYAAHHGAPVLIATGDVLPPETEEYLGTAADPPPPLVCGPLLGRRACDAAGAAVGLDVLHENATASDAPELVRAELLGVEDGAIRVRYVFDETVKMGPAGASRFRLVSMDTTALAAATAAAVSQDDPTAVDARFAEDHVTSHATLALADAGAVEDAGGLDSLDGSAEFSDAAPSPGLTRRPDLLSADAEDGAVVLHLDAPVETVVGRNVAVVLADGSVLSGGNGSLADGGRTVRVTVAGLSAAEARRVVARPGSLMTRTGSNPLMAVPVAGGLTEGPDLVQVVPKASTHSVEFLFDDDLAAFDANGEPTAFRLRYEDGTEVTSGAATTATGPRTVRAVFPEGAVNGLVVAAAVGAGAVANATEIASADDARGIARVFGFAHSFGPRLVEAERVAVDEDGVTVAVTGDTQVRLTFDRAVTSVSATRIAAVDRAGARVPVSGCTADPGIAQDTVTCDVPPAPIGAERRLLVAVTVAYDAVKSVTAWRTGSEPASGFGRGLSMPSLPMTLPFTPDAPTGPPSTQEPTEPPTEEPTDPPTDEPTEDPT